MKHLQLAYIETLSHLCVNSIFYKLNFGRIRGLSSKNKIFASLDIGLSRIVSEGSKVSPRKYYSQYSRTLIAALIFNFV